MKHCEGVAIYIRKGIEYQDPSLNYGHELVKSLQVTVRDQGRKGCLLLAMRSDRAC